MSTLYQDHVCVVTSITMRRGTETMTVGFPPEGPNECTLHNLVSLMIQGYVLDSFETVPRSQIRD